MILVTGATGNVGRHVVAGLLDRGVAVRALTRDPASARLPEGAEVVAGDLADPGGLDAALDGVDAVFLVWPTVAADHAAAKTVDRIAGQVGRVVYLSARGTPDTPDFSAEEAGPILASHALLEGLIERSGVEWTFLRPGGFAANTFWWIPQIRAGDEVRWFHAGAARSLIHERDIAAVGVRALTEGGHTGARYVLTGPRAVTQAEQVRRIGEAIGRPLRFVEAPPEQALRELVGEGWPPAMAESVIAAHAAMVAEPEPVTTTVQDVTGRPARTFREWAADHADDFR